MPLLTVKVVTRRPGGGIKQRNVGNLVISQKLKTCSTTIYRSLEPNYNGWSEPVVRLFRRMKDKVRNKLTKRQYEHEVSWSTSTWLALQAQRLSVALHIASAWEIATEMQLAGGGGEAVQSSEFIRA